MRLCGNLAMLVLLVGLAPRHSVGADDTKNGVAFKGRFSGRAGQRCTWTVSGEKLYTLNVTCVSPKGGKKLPGGYSCEYSGELALCPAFHSRPGAFRKQITRALQQNKQHVCTVARETVRARACKGAPAEAHFRLVKPYREITMTTHALRAGPPEDTPTTACTRSADHGELAREKCGSAWGSFCNFLFSMVQSRDC